MVRGRLVRRGRVVGLIFGVVGFTFIFDIGNKTIVVISSVGHSLDTAIGKSNLVRSRNGFAVSGLLGVEFGAGVVIGNTVLESIRLGGLIVVRGLGGRVVGSWGIGGGRGVVGSWGSSGESHGGGNDGGEDGKVMHDDK